MDVLKVKIGEDEFKVAAGAVFLGLNRRNPGDIVSIGLGQRNTHTDMPNDWGPIGGFIEEGESIKAGLMREIEEEIGLGPAATATKHYQTLRGRADIIDPKALIPLSVNINWESGTLYFTYAYFYYFDVSDEAQATKIDNKPQILPKHLHPSLLQRDRHGTPGPLGLPPRPYIRGLGFISLDPELQSFGNFGLSELWTSLHSGNIIGTHADIITMEDPYGIHNPPKVVIYPAAMDVRSLVHLDSLVPGLADTVDRLHAVQYEGNKWKTGFIQMQDIFEIGITENCLNWELLGPDQFGGTAGLRGVPRMRTPFYEANLAARTFLQALARPATHETGGTGLLGVLKEGLSGKDPNFREFTILPETCGFTNEEVIEWARENKFGNKWWYFLSDEYLAAFELSNMGAQSRSALMQTGTQESLPTPYLLFTQSSVGRSSGSGPHSKNIHNEEVQQEMAKVVFQILIHT